MRLIDADALMHRFMDKPPKYYHASYIVGEINTAPTIEERKTGRWIHKPDPYGFFDTIPVCSECGCTTKMRETYKFCPSCGARMEGEEE